MKHIYLDTNIIIEYFKDNQTIIKELKTIGETNIAISEDFNANNLIDYNLAGTNIQLMGRTGTSTMNAIGNLDELAYYNRAMDSTEIINMSTLSLEHLEQKTSFNIFPNPATTSFTLSNLPNNATIQLLDQKLINLNPDYFSYTLSKSALLTATEMMALDFAPTLRSVGLAPGITLPSGKQTEAEFLQAHQMTPMGYSSSADDIAQAALFIANAKAITGTTIYVDGGQHLIPSQRDVMFNTQ